VATTVRLAVKHQSSRRLRWRVLGTLALVFALAAVLWRIDTESVPSVVMRRTLATEIRLPGSLPTLSWPREGQAAVEVEGVGSFGSVGSTTPVPIASVAKIMTAYLTLREYPLAVGQEGFTMTVTHTDVVEEERRVDLDQSTVVVRTGERISERQALEALLLPSANNMAAMLAVHDAGRIAAFVARMNATARALGMRSTSYTDPSGFEQNTVSTAADQLKLAAVAMREPEFAAIVEEPSATLPVAGRVANYNGLVGDEGYVGVKTGSDAAAGGCLVFAKRTSIDGQTVMVLGVVLGQREGPLIDAALASARQLGDSAAAALRPQVAIPAGTNVLSVSSTSGRQTTVVTASALREIGWPGLTLPVQVHVGPTTKATTQLRAGEPLASVSVRGVGTPTTSAIVRQSLGRPSLSWRLRHLL
jgi:serine-type D-Ala-D-Ala carboxypeptidase (penicillin-binding protein 5/6)